MDDNLARINELFDLTEAQAQRYLQLRTLGTIQGATTEADEALIARGLAEKRGDFLAPASLRLALELRAATITEQLDAARAVAIELDSRSSQPTGSVCEVVYGLDAVGRAYNDIQLSAHRVIRSLDRGPYFGGGGDGELSLVQDQVSSTGVAYLTIVEQRALDETPTRETLRAGLALGESVRVIDNLPLRLMIADESLALLVLPRPPQGDSGPPSDVDVLLVYPSAFLDGLIAMFESFWHLSIPVDLPDSDGSPDIDNAQLLQLLANGMTDAALAHELNVSARTVQRRLNTLMHRYGAASRFQLGVQAMRFGLLDGALDNKGV